MQSSFFEELSNHSATVNNALHKTSNSATCLTDASFYLGIYYNVARQVFFSKVALLLLINPTLAGDLLAKRYRKKELSLPYIIIRMMIDSESRFLFC